jgi:hypothetical protein
MNKLKTVEYIIGGDYSIDAIKILQKYFQVDWRFAKQNYIYYIDPESDMAMCQPGSIIFTESDRYVFKQITLKTINHYVNRLQKPKDDFDRAVEQPTSRIQCTSSKATIASGHLEYRTINFRMGSKAKIGKANISI